jgi:LacI family transcriptional regulator
MATTRSDVALLAGVSPAVVSYVINDGPRPVSVATRAKVEAAVRELGYRPNAIASALRGGTTRSVGLLTPGQRDPHYAELVEVIERQFAELGYLVLTGNTNQDRAQEERYLHTFIDRKVDALLLSSGVTLARSGVRAMEEVPVVVLDNVSDRSDLSGIGWDEQADAATAVEHLQVHGHQSIACISGPPRSPVSAARVRGWRTQQQRAGLPHGTDLVAANEHSEEGGYSAAMSLLRQRSDRAQAWPSRPDALFVSSDVQAIGALCACLELGLRVPEDIALVAYGGTRAAAYTTPPLTTLRQDIRYVAQLAAAHTVQRITSRTTPPLHVKLRGNLVIGRTCGCDLVGAPHVGRPLDPVLRRSPASGHPDATSL